MQLELILIGLVLIGAALLVIAYLWYFIIQQSPLRLVVLVLRSALNRDRIVDENAPIEPRAAAFRSQALETQIDAAKHTELGAPSGVGTPDVPRMPLPPEEQLTDDQATTSDSGWPVKLDKQTSADPRAFRHINYRTYNEDHLAALPDDAAAPPDQTNPS